MIHPRKRTVEPNNQSKGQKALLQVLRSGSPASLEHLAAALIGRLLRVSLAIAKAGFQHGGDSGTSGRAGRHLRVECKRYADATPLTDRELQGEVDDALRRNPALEAWILVATRPVSENTQETLNLKAQEVGLPIVVIDWASPIGALPDLCALCAWAPDLVEAHYGTSAAAAARSMTASASAVVARIRNELEPWRIGYRQLRRSAISRLLRIWDRADDSRAALAQNAAGGASPHLIARRAASQALRAWWSSPRSYLAVVHGIEGVGKTWATLQWLVGTLRRLPIILTLPASAFQDVRTQTEGGLLEFLARTLVEVTNAQDPAFWQRRLARTLQSPASEDPQLLLLIDGLNQEPAYSWHRIVQLLQGGAFRGRVRLIVTTQSNFLEQRLHEFRGMPGVTRIGVEPYDTSPGGELEQMLARYGRTPESLSADLLPLARIPRLFPLVMKLSSKVELEGDATLPRLLWTYGRDELGARENRAFSEAEWEAWLLQLAQTLWHDIQAVAAGTGSMRHFSLDELDTMVSRQSLGPSLNYRRLSEIIDGTWMEQVPSRPHSYRPKASTVYLALGATVLQLLEETVTVNVDAADTTLATWLDPIAATSAAPDILAAALSIAVAKASPSHSAVVGAILTALLHSQNAQEAHRRHAVALAPVIVSPLLQAAERSAGRAYASSRHWALSALNGIPASNISAWEAISDRLVSWVAHAQCAHPPAAAGAPGSEVLQARRLQERIGVSEAGVYRVMGVPMRLHDWEQDDLASEVPRLLFGKPLVRARKVFAAAAVAAAIEVRDHAWQGLKWLVALNPVDPIEMATDLVWMSDGALTVVPEKGVDPDFRKRVACLLLWLTGIEGNERTASTMRVAFEHGYSYEDGYLPNPPRSLFGLEYRHLHLLWKDDGIALLSRLRKARRYLADPSLIADNAFVRLMEASADNLDTSRLDTSLSTHSEDHAMQDLTPGLARLAPDALARLVARWYSGLPARDTAPRHWASLRAPRYLLLADASAAAAARATRLNRPDTPNDQEPFIATQLLHIELLGASIDRQLDALVEASDAKLTLDLLDLLKPAEADTLKRFLDRWGTTNRRAVEVAFNCIARHEVALDADTFDRLVPSASSSDLSARNLAFIGLHLGSALGFGNFLRSINWRVAPSQTTFEQDHGSRALLVASTTTPLSQLRFIVAPWCLLSEAVRRGCLAEDAKVAAEAVSGAMQVVSVDVDLRDVDISIDLSRRPGQLSFDPPEHVPTTPQEMFDEDAADNRRARAYASGDRYLTQAHDAGAVLAAKVISVAEARMLIEHCSAEVEIWLAGHEQNTPEFRRRLNLGGGLYLALCEALLEVDWQRGVALWHAIDECLSITFKGPAGVNDLVRMPFRVRLNPGVQQLRTYLYSLARSRTDRAYLDLVICAAGHDSLAWIREKTAEDAASGIGWRRKRAILVNGFMTPSNTPTWPEGPTVGSWGAIRRSANTWANNESFARHWWRTFLDAENATQAFAAWNVFLLCADRRAWIWMSADVASHGRDDELGRAKLAHVHVNHNRLENALSDKETEGTNRMDKHLLGWGDPSEWFDPEQIASLGY